MGEASSAGVHTPFVQHIVGTQWKKRKMCGQCATISPRKTSKYLKYGNLQKLSSSWSFWITTSPYTIRHNFYGDLLLSVYQVSSIWKVLKLQKWIESGFWSKSWLILFFKLQQQWQQKTKTLKPFGNSLFKDDEVRCRKRMKYETGKLSSNPTSISPGS